ncbi:MAG: MATE family efflux transporter [Lachnospiraceae bacterium]|nr:MATE family efflux transporter [Lachnospiraceae bacterium]
MRKLFAVFEDREFNQKLASLVLPIALQQLMLAVVSASDALMLNLISQDKMSAVSLATQVTFVENLFLAAMTIGLSMLAAQYWGKKDAAAVERIFAYVMKITAAVCFVFFITALVWPKLLMRLLTNESVLINGGAEYLRIVSPSYLLTGVSQVCLCALKNCGRTKKASLINSVCMIGNLLLNLVLILGLFGFPRLEIAGAAMATTIARGAEVLWCITELSKEGCVKLRIRNILVSDKVLRRDFWKYTAPVLGNEIVWGIGFTMYSVIMGHLGSDAVAANSVAGIVKNLVCCLCLGLGSGGGIMIGNELGAGKTERARNYGDRLCVLSVLVGILSGMLLLVMRPFIRSAAELSGTATEYLNGMLLVCSYYMIGKSVNSTTISGIFCAGGDSKFGFLCDTVVMWCISVPLGFWAAFVMKLPVTVVYFIVSLDELIKLPAVYIHYKKYRWVKNLTKKEEF